MPCNAWPSISRFFLRASIRLMNLLPSLERERDREELLEDLRECLREWRRESTFLKVGDSCCRGLRLIWLSFASRVGSWFWIWIHSYSSRAMSFSCFPYWSKCFWSGDLEFWQLKVSKFSGDAKRLDWRSGLDRCAEPILLKTPGDMVSIESITSNIPLEVPVLPRMFSNRTCRSRDCRLSWLTCGDVIVIFVISSLLSLWLRFRSARKSLLIWISLSRSAFTRSSWSFKFSISYDSSLTFWFLAIIACCRRT